MSGETADGPSGGTRGRGLLAPALAVALALSVVAVVLSVVSLTRGPGGCSAAEVSRRTMPSVVTIFVQSSGGGGNGSGAFLDADGHILTNNHVISAAVPQGTITVQRPNGEQLPATIVGRDNATDLAVIKVDPTTSVTPIQIGGDVEVGDHVFAIGAPLGLTDTITSGVVGALGRSVRVPADHGSTALITSAIQTDAAINPGNSGGVLADCAGRLVGVPTAGATAQDSHGQAVAGSIGLGFAIPVDFAKRIADKLIADGQVKHADAGLAVTPIARGDNPIQPDGLYVSAVARQGPAAEAGLRQSDIITELDGQAVNAPDQLQGLLLSKQAGDELEVTFERDGDSHTATLTLRAQDS